MSTKKKVAVSPPGPNTGALGDVPETAPGSDDAIALQFAEQAKGKLLYVATEKAWYWFDGAVWIRDTTGKVRWLLRRYLRKMTLDTAGAEKMFVALRSERKIAAIERLAQSDPKLAASSAQFDTDPDILCTPAGIVELRSGGMRAACAEDYCRMITSIAPAEEWEPIGPLWRQMLDNLMGGDAELERFLQKVAGYALYGAQYEKLMFVIVGDTNSGKTTFWKTMVLALGGYGTTAKPDIFLVDRHGVDRSTLDIAEIRHARLVVMAEPEASARLSTQRIKGLVGRDPVTARHHYQGNEKGELPCAFVVHCNRVPHLGEGDQAVKDRLCILPGGKSIPRGRRVKSLDEQLKAEYPTILRWMIEGARLWAIEGLGDPPASALATSEIYYREEDTFAAWLAERTKYNPDAFTPTAMLAADYEKWCREAGKAALIADAFNKRLGQHQWEDAKGEPIIRQFQSDQRRVKGKAQRGFWGIELLALASAEKEEEIPW